MDLFGQRELMELVDYGIEPPCLSLYLPMERVTSEAHQNPVRFRNALRRAHEELVRWGASPGVVHEMLAPFEELLEREVYWLYQSDGLAVFAAPGYARTYRLPYRFPEEVAVGERFLVTPLLPLLIGNAQFLVLALEKYRVRLYGGGPSGLTELERERLPLDLWKALQVDIPEPVVQYRTGLRLGPGRTHMATHGHGYGREDLKRLMAEYYRMVDRALLPLGNERQLPLVLVGVEYEVAIYREVSHYPVLLPEFVAGSPESYSLHELHARAQEIVRRWTDMQRQHWLERFWSLYGKSPKATDEVTTIVWSAYEGRIEALFVRPEAELWGIVDHANRSVEFVEPGTPKAVRLLNEAVAHTFIRRGHVFALLGDELPAETAMAAVLRY